jgi:hypothetical protein
MKMDSVTLNKPERKRGYCEAKSNAGSEKSECRRHC